MPKRNRYARCKAAVPPRPPADQPAAVAFAMRYIAAVAEADPTVTGATVLLPGGGRFFIDAANPFAHVAGKPARRGG